MPSPFHQKYSSQSHKNFGAISALPDAPATAATEEKSADVASATSSPPARRRSSANSRFANLMALKQPNTEEAAARRASIQDHKFTSGMVGSMWNTFTRGPTTVTKEASKSSGTKDTTGSSQ